MPETGESGVTQDPQNAPVSVKARAASELPCFTPGTKIATERGMIAVEKLAVGDRVETLDNGVQAVAQTGTQTLTRAELDRDGSLRPVLVTKGALGDNVPNRDMLVSAKQKLLLQSPLAEMCFWEPQVLALAKLLAVSTATNAVKFSGVPRVTFTYLKFKAPQMVLADGLWCECLGVGKGYQAARMVLKPWEIAFLL